MKVKVDPVKVMQTLVNDLGPFSTDGANLISHYYPNTEMKTNLVYCMIQNRLKTPDAKPYWKVREDFIGYIQYKIEQRAQNALTKTENPWMSKCQEEPKPRNNELSLCLAASSHIEDVLFAAGTVAKHQYSDGIESTIEDIEGLIKALPTYPSLLSKAHKEQFIAHLHLLKNALRENKFSEVEAVLKKSL